MNNLNHLNIPAYDPACTVRSERFVIDAPAALVWEILLDMPRYGEWNPFCAAAESTLEMGAPVHMRLNSYTMPGEQFPNCEYICAKLPERLISWELREEDSLYPARRDQVIEPLGPGRCAYYSTDAFLGPHAAHVMYFCGAWVKRAFDDTGRALKARAEAFFAAQRQQRLEDIEAIKQLKYAYVRALDTCDMVALERLFTEDAKVDYRGGSYRLEAEGRPAIIAALGEAFHAEFVAAHTVHMPVIEIAGDTATGLWTLRDYAMNLADGNHVTEGTAHYRDLYVRGAGGWQIAASAYDRVYERVYREEQPGLTAHLLAAIHAARGNG